MLDAAVRDDRSVPALEPLLDANSSSSESSSDSKSSIAPSGRRPLITTNPRRLRYGRKCVRSTRGKLQLKSTPRRTKHLLCRCRQSTEQRCFRWYVQPVTQHPNQVVRNDFLKGQTAMIFKTQDQRVRIGMKVHKNSNAMQYIREQDFGCHSVTVPNDGHWSF